MIYDLGCLDQPDNLQKIFTALPGAVAAFAIVAGLAVIGAFLNRSPRFRAYDIFSGWGFVAAVMTLSAVLFEKALPFATLALFALIAFCVISALKRRYFISPFWLLAFFPGLFVLAAINIAGIAKWDDFSQWVPNALYLFQNDSVPGRGLPEPHSVWPGYPYALPFLTYMASWLVNGFLVQGGAMINFLLLIAFAAMLTEIHEQPADANSLNLRTIGKMALAVAIVTVANPSFNASFTVTNQGDAATMILTGALGLLLVRMIDGLRENNRGAANALITAIALIATAMVLVKQSNMVLLILMLFGFLIVAAKNRNLKTALIHALIIILPALAMRMIWEHYVNVEMAGNGFKLHLLSAWRFDLLGPLLHSILQEMIKKNGSTILMLAVVGYGAISFFRPSTSLRNFASMASTVCVGYLVFLVIIYIGASFTEDEVRRAASFYRYTTHTGLLSLSALWMAAPDFWERIKNKIPPLLSAPSRTAHAVMVSAIVALLPIVILIDADAVVPQPAPATCQIRSFGQKLAAALPDHSRLIVLEPETEGLFTFMINFELDLQAAQTKKDFSLMRRMSRSRDAFDREKLPEYMEQIDQNPQITTILVPKAENVPLTINGYNNRQAPLVLERDGKEWKPLNPEQVLAAPGKSR